MDAEEQICRQRDRDETRDLKHERARKLRHIAGLKDDHVGADERETGYRHVENDRTDPKRDQAPVPEAGSPDSRYRFHVLSSLSNFMFP